MSIVQIKSEPVSDSTDGASEPTGNFDPENDDSDSDPPSSGILHAHFYNNNPRLPVYRYGLTEGLPTKEIVMELLNVDDDSRVATTTPSNVQHNYSRYLVPRRRLGYKERRHRFVDEPRKKKIQEGDTGRRI